jgi:Zn-dependent protease with chaperone function
MCFPGDASQDKHAAMGEYPGQVLHERFPRGRKGGSLHVSAYGMVFDTGEERIAIPLEGLSFSVGGSGNRLTYLQTPGLPGYSFYTTDRTVLREPIFQQHADVAARVREASSTHRRSHAGLLLSLALAGLLGWLLYRSYDPLVHRAARQVPVTWEQAIGEKLQPLVTANSRTIEDTELAAQLARITEPISAAAAAHGGTFTFTVVKNTDANAFALPGGRVVIFSGLLMKARNAEEVAGVVAHEIAHVTLRHHVRALIKNAGLSVLAGILAGDASSFGAVLVDSASSLSSLSYSRDFEVEADLRGREYLIAASIDPAGMVSFFESLLADESETLRGLEENLSILSTHPATKERIERLKKLGGPSAHQQIPIDYPAFKAHLARLLETVPDPPAATP